MNFGKIFLRFMLKEIQIEEKEILKRKQLQEVKLLSELTNSDYIIKCVDIFYGVTDLVKSKTFNDPSCEIAHSALYLVFELGVSTISS